MINPERNLFVAILNRAALDAIGVGGVDRWHDERAFRDARSFIRADNPDFRIVAELAGFSPDYAADRITRQIERLRAEGIGSKGRKRWAVRADGESA